MTFLFSDVEGSTSTLARLGDDAYSEVLADHHTMIRDSIGAHGGEEVSTAGDGFFVAFARPSDAVAAALAAQLAVASYRLPTGGELRVRMGIHTGEALLTDTGYVGMAVHAAARISAVAHGGQVLLSDATRSLVEPALPSHVTLRSLGAHRLKDLTAPQIVHQLCHPELSDAFPPLRSLDRPLTNLPAPASSLVGRETEVQAVTDLLSTERIVMLVGPGGAGKTRLALHCAAAVTDRFRDGVWLVELAPLSEPDAVPDVVAEAIGVRSVAGNPMEAVIEFLRTRQLLLVIDNCEHLVSACLALIAPITAACPEVHIVATSREALGLLGESVWRIPSLEVPSADASTEAIRASAAVRLFEERARQVAPDFALDDASTRLVAEICRRLDGLPLAIELAAARVRVIAVDQIAARLDDRFRLLTGGDRSALARQQTLQAAVGWSHDLLSPDEQATLRRLSVFAGGWTLDAAEAVVADADLDPMEVLDHLTSLVDKSLVVVDRATTHPRYLMLETIRHFARDRLLAAGETAAARGRHLQWCLDLGHEAAPHLQGPTQSDWFDVLDSDRENLRLALEWAASGDQAELEAGLRLGGSLHLYFTRRGLTDDARRLLAPLLERRGEAPKGSAVHAFLALMDAVAYQIDPTCGRVAAEALEVALDAGDLASQAEALFVVGFEAANMADPADTAAAVVLIREAAQLARTSGDRRVLSKILTHLARLGDQCGDRSERMAVARESLALGEAIGDEWSIGAAFVTLGTLALEEHDLDSAEHHFLACLQMSRRLGFLIAINRSLSGLMRVAGARRDVDSVRQLATELRDAADRLGDHLALADSLMDAAISLLAAGETDLTRWLIDESLTLLRKGSRPVWLAIGLLRLAELERVVERPGDALRAIEESTLILRGLGTHQFDAWLLASRGHVWLAARDNDAAMADFRDALAVTAEDNVRVECLRGVAVVRARAGEHRDAVELMASIDGHPALESLTVGERAERTNLLDTGRAELGDEQFDAAWIRGRGRVIEQSAALVVATRRE
ncbi:MAG: adenylate/guanylate cyclase domain-containing protein [Microthrixaceae bacterium]